MTEDLREQIASRLRSARKSLGLSQEQVAKKLGMHRPTISEIEAGRRRVSAEELAQLAAVYGFPIERFTSGHHAEVGPEDERLNLAIRLLKALKHEDLDRVVTWICEMQKLKDSEEEQEDPCAPAVLVKDQKTGIGGIQEDASEERYVRCLHYDVLVGDPQTRENSRCSARIRVRDDGKPFYFCSEHQGEAPGEPATPEELDEIRADLETRPGNSRLLQVLTTVRDARSMKADGGNREKQLLSASPSWM
jgi:transcriptional regulator with XRE-family HTH domain